MSLVIAASALIILVAGVCLWLVARSTFGSPEKFPMTTDRLLELSAEAYRPMLRLLNDEDIQFLRSQSGFTPAIEAALRINRCRIMRAYVRAMRADFGLICAALKIVMAQSQCDRPDLASALVRSQLLFTWGVIVVEVRLLLFRHGFAGLDVTSPFTVFDGMLSQLQTLAPAANAA